MIARLQVSLPYYLTVPGGEPFKIYSYNDEGYVVQFYPPVKTEIPELLDDVKEIQINGVPAFRTNVFYVEFHRTSFDRRKNIECDPTYDFIRRTLNYFLHKLRFVTKQSQIKPVDFPNLTWDISYLNDDSTELQKEEGLVRGRSMIMKRVSWNAMNSQIWEGINQLPPDYIPPEWDSLLLDAVDLLPEIGPAIVLAMTALEVFISKILDAMAVNSSIPKDLWKWINNRDWWLKNPAVEEQFDTLLYILSGVSFKKEKRPLWDAFKNLKKARNSFVHDGVAKVGDRVATQKDGAHLVKAAGDIIGFVRELLPEEMRWPQLQYKLDVQVLLKVL